MGYGLYDPNPLVEWADSWWVPLSCSLSLVSRVPMVPNLVTDEYVGHHDDVGGGSDCSIYI
jgi:hypothetical protein